MSDKTNPIFTSEEVSQQAQGNVRALCLVMTAYLKEHGLSTNEFWSFAGHQFAPSWKQGASAKEVALGITLNMVSAGCNLRSLSGNESQAESVITGWPNKEMLAASGLTQEEADSLWEIFNPIAKSLGYVYAWHRQGDEVTVNISRQ